MKMKTIIVSIGILLLMSMSGYVSASQNSTTIEFRPREDNDLFKMLRNRVVPFLLNMKDANFTTGDVLYNSFSVSNEYTFDVGQRIRNQSYQISDLQYIKNRINNTIQKLEFFNNTVIVPAAQAAFNIWNSSSFINGTDINRSTFDDNFRQFVIAFIAFHIVDAGNDPSGRLDRFINWLNSTTLEQRERIVIKEVRERLNLDLIFLYRVFDHYFPDQERPNVLTLIKIMINRLSKVRDEIGDHTKLIANRYERLQGSKTVSVTMKGVVIFWDNDTSVIQALDKIKNNETLTTQPFTGDEHFTFVQLSAVKEKTTGSLDIRTRWTYEDGETPAFFLKNWIQIVAAKRVYARDLNFFRIRENLDVLRMLLSSAPYEHYERNANNASVNARIAFSISQLNIDNLTFGRSGVGNFIRKLDFRYAEHHALGMTIFNDTNANGIMDIGVKSVPSTNGGPPILFPSRSNESLYRVDIRDYAGVTFDNPQTEDDVLSFGVSASSLEVALVPIHENRDLALFNSSVAEDTQTIDDFSFKLHFSKGGNRAKLKFDYLLGEWSDPAALDGFGLNFMYLSTVRDTRAVQHRIKLENGTEVNPDSEIGVRTKKFDLRAGDLPVGDIELDNIPYTWNGTVNTTAYGQTLPLAYSELLFGSLSSEGNIVRTLRVASKKSTFLYSISYPNFSGLSISHDPSYSAVVVGAGGSGEPTDTNINTIPAETSNVPGFEFLGVLLALPVFTLLYRKRKK